jgi:hypothetical protein
LRKGGSFADFESSVLPDHEGADFKDQQVSSLERLPHIDTGVDGGASSQNRAPLVQMVLRGELNFALGHNSYASSSLTARAVKCAARCEVEIAANLEFEVVCRIRATGNKGRQHHGADNADEDSLR